jgi:hypothetical protein
MIKKLTHPFLVRKNVGMVHNGIIPIVGPANNESDTSVYANILHNRYEDPMAAMKNFENRVNTLLEIGLSKMVFMNGNGTVNILNGQMGHWGDDGCWYSNHSYTDHRSYDAKYGELDYAPTNWRVSTNMLSF